MLTLRPLIQRVIPAVSALAQLLPLKFEMLVSRDMLSGIGMKSNLLSLQCSNLEQSDEVFGLLKLK